MIVSRSFRHAELFSASFSHLKQRILCSAKRPFFVPLNLFQGLFARSNKYIKQVLQSFVVFECVLYDFSLYLGRYLRMFFGNTASNAFVTFSMFRLYKTPIYNINKPVIIIALVNPVG